jgi:hypothetical protein
VSKRRIDRPPLPETTAVRTAAVRTAAVRTTGVRHTWPGWSRWPCWCPRRPAAPDRCPVASCPPAQMWTRGGLAAATANIAPVRRVADAASGPLLPQTTAALTRGDRGRCPATMTTRGSEGWDHPAADTSAIARPACRPGSGHRRTRCRVQCHLPGAVLREPASGDAAAGGMQPAPVDASQPGGQAAAELPADVGHRRPGERAGLLQAEIVDLQHRDRAVGQDPDADQGVVVGRWRSPR